MSVEFTVVYTKLYSCIYSLHFKYLSNLLLCNYHLVRHFLSKVLIVVFIFGCLVKYFEEANFNLLLNLLLEESKFLV